VANQADYPTMPAATARPSSEPVRSREVSAAWFAGAKKHIYQCWQTGGDVTLGQADTLWTKGLGQATCRRSDTTFGTRIRMKKILEKKVV